MPYKLVGTACLLVLVCLAWFVQSKTARKSVQLIMA